MDLSGIQLALAVFLMLNVMGGLLRVARGPTRADRMLAAQVLGTAGVALLLVLGEVQGIAALQDAALVFALLAAIAIVAFVKRVGRDRAIDRAGSDLSPRDRARR
jgi:multicomponent Na+:H+ antiporter subunit F